MSLKGSDTRKEIRLQPLVFSMYIKMDDITRHSTHLDLPLVAGYSIKTKPSKKSILKILFLRWFQLFKVVLITKMHVQVFLILISLV